MQIKELLNYLKIASNDEKVIKSVVTSTKEVEENCVLILTKGHTIDPNLLLNKDIIKKCLIILSDQKNENVIFIENLKDRVFEILDFVYFRFKHNFKIIGITGSEGKSSLSNIIYQGLKVINKKVMLISNYCYDKDVFLSELTTPTSKDIILAMQECQKRKYEYLIFEVSCIGISEKRISSKIFDYLFLTSLEVDHLDYYQNIYQYHLSKISLLQNNIKGKKFILKSSFDKYPHLFEKVTNLKIIDENEIILKKSSLNHQVFSYKNVDYYTHLIFKQNRINLAFLIEFLISIHAFNFKYNIKKIKRVEGRLDLVHTRPYVLIDNAHSKQSVENVLKEISLFKQNKLICVIGAGGNRDKTKRSEYGKSCLKYCEEIYVCNDNPRKEDPYKIASMIALNNDFKIILNRKKAISEAIKNASRDDIIVILGRGNEEYQIINDKRIYLNDYEEVKKCFIK